MKKIVDNWDELRKKVKNLIDDHLKVKTIKQAQKERLFISIKGTKRIITSYNDIGKSFKNDGSRKTLDELQELQVVNLITNPDTKLI